MSTIIVCPNCEARYKVDLTVTGGKAVKCQKCGQQFSSPPAPPPPPPLAQPVPAPPTTEQPSPIQTFGNLQFPTSNDSHRSDDQVSLPPQDTLPRGAGNPMVGVWDNLTKEKCPNCEKPGGVLTKITILDAEDRVVEETKADHHYDSQGRYVGKTQYEGLSVRRYYNYLEWFQCCYCGYEWYVRKYGSNPGGRGCAAAFLLLASTFSLVAAVLIYFITLP